MHTSSSFKSACPLCCLHIKFCLRSMYLLQDRPKEKLSSILLSPNWPQKKIIYLLTHVRWTFTAKVPNVSFQHLITVFTFTRELVCLKSSGKWNVISVKLSLVNGLCWQKKQQATVVAGYKNTHTYLIFVILLNKFYTWNYVN